MKPSSSHRQGPSAVVAVALACACLISLPRAAFGGSVEVGASKDIEINSSWQTCPSPLGSATTLRTGYDADVISITHRSLLHFDLAGAGAPSSAKLINARLVFYAQAQTGADFDLSVHRLTEPAWSETATWPKANCETPLSWANAGGDFESTASATFTSKGAGFYSVSITALAQDAVDNRSGQLRLVLKGADSLAWDNWLDIRSSEYATAAYQPSVLLTWGNAGDQTGELEAAKDLELQAVWWNCPTPMQSATTMRLGYDDAKIPDAYRS